jgi:hypothetical protein
MNITLPIEPKATEWVEENISSNMIIFEYGSGASTVYFSKRAKIVISVEHNPQKYYKMWGLLDSNVNYNHIESVKDLTPFPYSHESYGSTDKNFLEHNFKNYVNYIKRCKYKIFDMVFINGRSRASCIREAVSHIKTGGYLILNDSERYEYQNAIELFLKENSHQEFGESNRKTGIWTIDN